jgi:trimeric autotransporter adhesin
MKKIKHLAGLALILFTGALTVSAQNIGIGITTPDASAVLDVNATNKGLLIPRVALTSLTDAVTITAPANSLLVYNTNGAVPGGVGFYYNSGKGSAIWVKLLTGSGSGSGWGLTGNATTDSTLNFIGTTDLKPLVFRVNNAFAGQMSSIGGISLGRAANATTRIAEPGVIAIGDSALFSNLDNREVAIGNQALFSNTTGQVNTAVGNYSMISNTTGSANVAVGDLSLASNFSSVLNTAVGYRALLNSDNDANTAVGGYALSENISGFLNVAVGEEALTTNVSGSGNTAVGTFSLYLSDGIRNTAIGYQALDTLLTGSRNTAVGSDALGAITTGSFNTAIGDSADVTGLSAGLLFNTTTVGYRATTGVSNSVRIGNTQVTSIGGQVNWSVLSDGRYKKDVNEDVKGLDFIMQLRPVTYHYDFEKVRAEKYFTNSSAVGISNNVMHAAYSNLGKFSGKKILDKNILLDRTKSSLKTSAGATVNPDVAKYYEEVKQNDQIRYTGFVAQEVEAAANKIGFNFSGVDKPKNDTGQYALRYAEFVVPLVKAVQEQQAIITSQNKKIEDLLKRIETLEAAKQ